MMKLINWTYAGHSQSSHCSFCSQQTVWHNGAPFVETFFQIYLEPPHNITTTLFVKLSVSSFVVDVNMPQISIWFHITCYFIKKFLDDKSIAQHNLMHDCHLLVQFYVCYALGLILLCFQNSDFESVLEAIFISSCRLRNMAKQFWSFNSFACLMKYLSSQPHGMSNYDFYPFTFICSTLFFIMNIIRTV